MFLSIVDATRINTIGSATTFNGEAPKRKLSMLAVTRISTTESARTSKEDEVLIEKGKRWKSKKVLFFYSFPWWMLLGLPLAWAQLKTFQISQMKKIREVESLRCFAFEKSQVLFFIILNRDILIILYATDKK